MLGRVRSCCDVHACYAAHQSVMLPVWQSIGVGGCTLRMCSIDRYRLLWRLLVWSGVLLAALVGLQLSHLGLCKTMTCMVNQQADVAWHFYEVHFS